MFTGRNEGFTGGNDGVTGRNDVSTGGKFGFIGEKDGETSRKVGFTGENEGSAGRNEGFTGLNEVFTGRNEGFTGGKDGAKRKMMVSAAPKLQTNERKTNDVQKKCCTVKRMPSTEFTLHCVLGFAK